MTLFAGVAVRRFPILSAAARPPAAGGADGAATPAGGHVPVMCDEAVAALKVSARPGPARTFVDLTYGRGGHSRAILAAMAGRDRLFALDRDPAAVAHARASLADREGVVAEACNFAQLRAWAGRHDLVARVDGMLADLGVSSPQLDDPARGFSFDADGPLDMRMDPQHGEPVSAWLARADERDIADVLWRYGEERNSRRIARRIVAARALAPITHTAQLAALIAAVPGPRSRHIHPATRSFQALRILINGELDALAALLAAAPALLAPGGRLAVISFHSLEDRLVKRAFRDGASAGRDGKSPAVYARPRRLFPDVVEIAANPRSRSAVLRVVERLPS